MTATNPQNLPTGVRIIYGRIMLVLFMLVVMLMLMLVPMILVLMLMLMPVLLLLLQTTKMTAELAFFWSQPIYSFGKPDVLCQRTAQEASFASDIGNTLKNLAIGAPPDGVSWAGSRTNSSSAPDLELVLTPGRPYKMQPSERREACDFWLAAWAAREVVEAAA